jgi:hypothetical protein
MPSVVSLLPLKKLACVSLHPVHSFILIEQFEVSLGDVRVYFPKIKLIKYLVQNPALFNTTGSFEFSILQAAFH